MRGAIAKATVIVAITLAPAIALAATSTYAGRGTDDRVARIELRVQKQDGKRAVKRLAVEKLRYEAASAFCSTSGRTGRLPLVGPFRVARDGSFRARGQTHPGDISLGGELKVVGDVTRRKVTGIMRFTFGKDGCKTRRTEFKARRR